MQPDPPAPRRHASRADGLAGFHSALGLLLAFGSLAVIELAAYKAQEDLHSGLGVDVNPRGLASASSSLDGCEGESNGTSVASAADGSSSTGHAGEHKSEAFEPVIFFIIAYLSSALAQQISILLPPRIRVPHSVMLYVIGGLLGWLGDEYGRNSEFGQAIINFMHIDPHVIFWILLPALLYEDASGVHWHVFERCCPNALLLAVPGVIVNSVLTGVIVKVCFTQIEWSWAAAFLLGSILSATDPVAVVAALHSLAAPDKLSSLISGESLFNDGSAVVLFQLFWDVARKIREFDMGYAVYFFVRMALGGPLLGIAISSVVWIWLRKTVRFQIEILVIVVTIYGLFFVAEHEVVKVSGVLAVVCFGFFMASTGHFALDIDKEHEHHAIMNFLGLLSNEAIFIVAGIVTYRLGFRNPVIVLKDYLELVLLYFIVHITRATVIFLFWPLLRTSGYGLTWKEALVCVYGGLRGAVGLAMALLVEHDTRLEEDTRARIAFHVSGIAFFTLLINGTTVTMFYKNLKVYNKAAHHEQLLMLALKKADAMTQRHARHLREHWFFHNCHFDQVMRMVPNLSGAAEKLHHTTKLHLTTRDISQVMEDVATKLHHEDLEEHLVKKIVVSWRHAADNQSSHAAHAGHHANPFLLVHAASFHVNLDSGDQEDELELAMQIVEEEVKDDRPINPEESMASAQSLILTAQRSNSTNSDEENAVIAPSTLNGAGGSTVVHRKGSIQPTDSMVDRYKRRKLARQRWKWAFMRVKLVSQVMKESRARRLSFEQTMQMNHHASRTSRDSSHSHFLERTVRNDEASMVEVHQTVVNASRATYKSMFGARSLGADPYRILMDSLNIQEEAIAREMSRRPFGRRVSTRSIRSVAPDEDPQQHHAVRLAQSFSEAWKYIDDTLGYPTSTVFWVASKICSVHHWLEALWCLLKRDMEIVIAYVISQEHLLDDLEILDDFKDEVKKPMQTTLNRAKKEGLMRLVKSPRDRGMFMLFEHIFLARLTVRAQSHLLEHLVHDGILMEEDAELLSKHVLRPTESALSHYVPTREQLAMAGSEKVDNYKGNCFKSLLMRIIVELEFNEEEWD